MSAREDAGCRDPRLTALRVADEGYLHRVRGVVMRNPQAAYLHLLRRIDSASIGNGLRPDLAVMLTETLYRMGRPNEAVIVASEAADVALALTPRDWPRVVRALGVAADTSVLADLPEAAEACDILLLHAQRHRESAPQIVVGYMLCALAKYRRGCRAGRAQLAEVMQVVSSSSAYMPLLQVGMSAMQERCGSTHWRLPSGPPPAMPGGLLLPAFGRPALTFLRHRVMARRHACSRCVQTSLPTGSQT